MEGDPVLLAVASAANIALGSIRDQGIGRWNLETGERVQRVRLPAEARSGWPVLSADGRRMAIGVENSVWVYEGDRRIAQLPTTGAVRHLALSPDGARVVVGTEDHTLSVREVGSGRELRAVRGDPQAMSFDAVFSPDGELLAYQPDVRSLRVIEVSSGRSRGQLNAGDLAEDGFSPIRAFAFSTGEELMLNGPGAPGYSRIYRWTPGARAVATELQVLGSDAITVNQAGVVFVYDGNEQLHLLHQDGTLLATVYSAAGGAWVAQAPTGAVDGPVEGRSALLTWVDGRPRDFAWWVGWDRFHVPGLVESAATGQRVGPVRPGLLLTVETWEQTESGESDG